tara:strand:- start:146 stop:370 length:225 start_codon:yes stop_codon:yes gene_type:complete
MKNPIYTIILLGIVLVLGSCENVKQFVINSFTIKGHLKVHNPRHDGKITNFTDERILLGELIQLRLGLFCFWTG